MRVTATTPQSPLRRERCAQNLRLIDVAEKAQIAVSYLSMIERGLTPPRPVQKRIARALGCAVEELFE